MLRHQPPPQTLTTSLTFDGRPWRLRLYNRETNGFLHEGLVSAIVRTLYSSRSSERTRYTFFALVVLSCATLLASARPAFGELTKFSPATTEARLGRILELVGDSNAPNLVGVRKWRTLIGQHREEIVSARTHRQFAAGVNRLIHDAGISHFGYYYDEQWKFWHMRGVFGGNAGDVAHVGIIPERIDGRWHVRGILEGSPCDGVDVRVGDELVSVDGFTYQPVTAFAGTEGRSVRLRVRRKAGLTYNIDVVPVKESLYEAMQRAIHNSVRVIEHDGLKFAYVHAWTTLGGGGEYDSLLGLQKDVDGLLLDYRDGFGGMWHRPLAFLLGSDRDSPEMRINPEWTKPVVILIADGTRSAKEIIVDQVRKYHRAPLVGEPSVGHVISVGGIRRVGDDGLLLLPGHRFELEGKPILPDYPVERTIAYSAGADPQIRMAKQILAERIRQKRTRTDPKIFDKPTLFLQP